MSVGRTKSMWNSEWIAAWTIHPSFLPFLLCWWTLAYLPCNFICPTTSLLFSMSGTDGLRVPLFLSSMCFTNSKTFNQRKSGQGPLNMLSSSGKIILPPPPRQTVRMNLPQCIVRVKRPLFAWSPSICSLEDKKFPKKVLAILFRGRDPLAFVLLCPNWILKMSRKHWRDGLGLLNVLTWNDHNIWRNKGLIHFRAADWNVSQYAECHSWHNVTSLCCDYKLNNAMVTGSAKNVIKWHPGRNINTLSNGKCIQDLTLSMSDVCRVSVESLFLSFLPSSFHLNNEGIILQQQKDVNTCESMPSIFFFFF